jgi:hypothetical protein
MHHAPVGAKKGIYVKRIKIRFYAGEYIQVHPVNLITVS